jgi:hypothetical protein
MAGGNSQDDRNFPAHTDSSPAAVHDLGKIGRRDPKAASQVSLIPALSDQRQPNFLDPFRMHSYNPANLVKPVKYSSKA